MLRPHPARAALALGASLASPAAAAFARGLLSEPGGDDRFGRESFEAFADAHEPSGRTLTVLGPRTGADEVPIEEVVKCFAAATGGEVRYSGTGDLEQDVVVGLDAGSPASLSAIARPGLAADLAAQGFLTPLAPGTDAWAREHHGAGNAWGDLATFPGPEGEGAPCGLFSKVDVRSLVRYGPENFEAAGYEVPETLKDLRALTEAIVEDGETPWCIGLGSGGDTGWPGTDRVEDMMPRVAPPETYDRW